MSQNPFSSPMNQADHQELMAREVTETGQFLVRVYGHLMGAIVAVVGNPIILKLHDMFASTLLANRPRRAPLKVSDRISYDEHVAIYEAIVAGDPMKAAELTDQHLMRSYRSRLAGAGRE